MTRRRDAHLPQAQDEERLSEDQDQDQDQDQDRDQDQDWDRDQDQEAAAEEREMRVSATLFVSVVHSPSTLLAMI
eukprot:2641071-Rhodomonas_salina.2